MAAVLLSPFLGGGLGGGAAVAVLGGLLFGLGVAFALWAVVRLGSSLTPFPAPRPDPGV